MSLKNYYQIITRTLFTAALLFGIGMKAQNAFLISFPAAPQDLTVCNGSSKLTVQLDATIASTTGADVTIQLATGVNYVPGSVALVSTIGGLAIADNGGTANAPKFKISPATIAPGNRIIFTIDRIATCAARTFALASGIFTDSVTASIGAQSDTKVSSSYQVNYPVVNFTQPVTPTDIVVGGTYTRTFFIKNGGNGCLGQLYLSLDNPGSGIQQISLQVTQQNGVAVAPITITPTSTSGTTTYYTVPSTALPGGDLCLNENITITETYKVKVCYAVTNYGVGWGCDPAPANWCTTSTGTGSIGMATGTPSFTSTGTGLLNYVNQCTDSEYSFTITNSGTGSAPKAAAMYNVQILQNMTPNHFATFNNGPTEMVNLFNVRVGTASVPLVFSTDPAHGGNRPIFIDTSQLTTDPDGPGVGLEDLDGDGQYDDLLPGASVTVKVGWHYNDVAVCGTNGPGYIQHAWQPVVNVRYTTMCSSTYTMPQSYVAPTGSSYYYGLSGTNFTPSFPLNIMAGTPFRVSINFRLDNFNWPAASNGGRRWRWIFDLPAGVSVAGTGNPTYGGTATTYTQVGNTVTIQSPDPTLKVPAIDFVYTCGTGGSVTIPYRLEYVDDIINGCFYNKNFGCSSFTFIAGGCSTGCSLGPVSSIPVIRRDDASLGYTNANFTTHVTAASLPAIVLAHATFNDVVLVSGNMTQQGTASNLYARLRLNKNSAGVDKLTPLSAAVTATIGGVTSTYTLPASACSLASSTATYSDFVWNLNSCLPAGTITTGDTVGMVAQYRVATNNLDTVATNVLAPGGSYHYFNIDTATSTEVTCQSWTPELYLHGTSFGIGFGNQSGQGIVGCNEMSVQFNLSNTTQGLNVYTDAGEYRPNDFLKSFTVTVPSEIESVRYQVQGTTYTPTTHIYNPTSVSGNTYTFVNDGTWPVAVIRSIGGGITGDLLFKGSCTQSATRQITVTSQWGQFYNADVVPRPSLPASLTYPVTDTRSNTYTRTGIPAIQLSNQTGVVQASKLTESFVVRMSSTGTATAPYIWIAIPSVSGVTINQVVDVATNTPISLIPYSGGVWAQLSATGLASGTYNDYRIVFTYTTCNSTSFAVNAGWNCTGYPTDPGAYPCTPSTANLTFVPQPAAIQINTITQPAGSINLCTPLNYEFRVNSAGAGNTINNKFNINLPAGLSFVPGSLLVEYPVGAGNWQAVSSTTASGITTLDLTTHTAYPAQGLPGTLNDGGNANVRQMGVKFSLTTDCSFTSGSYVILSTDADRTCGLPATGSGSLLSTSTLNVAGADPGYVLNSSVTNPNAPIVGCAGNLTLHIKQIVILSTATGTPATATVTVNYPPGYDITSTTPNCFPTTTYCPTFVTSGTNPLTGLGYATYSIPVGMQTSDFLEYELTFQPNATIDNGNYQAVVTTDDVINGLSCPSAPGGTCSSVNVRTSSAVYSYTLQCYCYKNAVTSGTVLDTKHGITSLGRAGTANGNWPMVRKGAWTALEAKTKGFVVNRLTDAQIAAIPAAQLVEGMMVYNITQDCLQINVDGTAAGWKCFNTQTCPDY